MNWFRVPSHIIHMEPADAAGWLWLLGLWHSGHAPRHNEIRRKLGWGAGKVQAFIPRVARWALENGAQVPCEVAEQFRSSTGALAEQERSSTGAVGSTLKADNQERPEQHRSRSGALAEQERSDSRARDPLSEIEREKTEKREKSAPSPQIAQEPLQPPQPAQTTTVLPIAAQRPLQADSDPMLAQSIQVVWQSWRIGRPGPIAPHPKVAESIAAALSVASVESLVLLLEWWRDESAPKSDPVWWRINRPNHGIFDVLNGQKLECRLADSAAWNARGRVAQCEPAQSMQSTPNVKKRTFTTGAPNGLSTSSPSSPGTVGLQLPAAKSRSVG